MLHRTVVNLPVPPVKWGKSLTLIIACLLCASLSSADQVKPIAPCRLLDTRSGSPLAASTAMEIDVRGECLIPESATGVVFNLTVVSPAGTGYLKAYGTSVAPDTAVITYNSGETVVTTGAMVWLSVDDENTPAYDPPSWGIKILSSQSTHVVIDVTGYVALDPTDHFQGLVTSTQPGNGPPSIIMTLDTLFPGLYLVCREPWADPEACEEFQVNDEVCGTAHIGPDGGNQALYVHTMNCF